MTSGTSAEFSPAVRLFITGSPQDTSVTKDVALAAAAAANAAQSGGGDANRGDAAGSPTTRRRSGKRGSSAPEGHAQEVRTALAAALADPPPASNGNLVWTTKHVHRNGTNPEWCQDFYFVLSHAELAMLTLRVVHRPTGSGVSSTAVGAGGKVGDDLGAAGGDEGQPDAGGSKKSKSLAEGAAASATDDATEELVAENSIPVQSLRLGYRAVPLRLPESFNFVDHASVLCHFSLVEERRETAVGRSATHSHR
jgi:hypothetical protein